MTIGWGGLLAPPLLLGLLASRPINHWWINLLSLLRMDSATPDLRLPSQPQDIAASRLILLGVQRHVCEQLVQGDYT